MTHQAGPQRTGHTRKRKFGDFNDAIHESLQDILFRLRKQRKMFKNIRLHETKMQKAPKVSNVRSGMHKLQGRGRGGLKPPSCKQKQRRTRGEHEQEGHKFNEFIEDTRVPGTHSKSSTVTYSIISETQDLLDSETASFVSARTAPSRIAPSAWGALSESHSRALNALSATIAKPRFILPSDTASVVSARKAFSTLPALPMDITSIKSRQGMDHLSRDPSDRRLPCMSNVENGKSNLELYCGLCENPTGLVSHEPRK